MTEKKENYNNYYTHTHKSTGYLNTHIFIEERETETGRHRDKETWIQRDRESRAEKLNLCRETEN